MGRHRFKRVGKASRLAVLGVTVVAFLAFAAASAFADAGNPIAGTINATATVDGPNTVTISVRGQWNWLSHDTDCNYDRAGTGVGIVWNDPTEPGYTVANKGGTISAQVGIASVRAGDSVNTVDRMVHPVDIGNKAVDPALPGAAGQQFNDPTPPDPAKYLDWKGGCGNYSASGPYPNHPFGSWGYTKTYSHQYEIIQSSGPNQGKSGLPEKICVNFYDVHGGGATVAKGFQKVKSADEITVDKAGDNSIRTNDYDISEGSNCVSVSLLIVKKVVINDNGGTKKASDFSFHGTAGPSTIPVTGFTTKGDDLHGENVLALQAGMYDIVEGAHDGYTVTYDNCSGVVVGGGAVPVCTITNNDIEPPNPNLSLTKSDNLNPQKYDHVGQIVTYTLTAKNTGNVTLHNVAITDNPALGSYSCDPAAGSDLDPGDSMVCTGTHSITQADLDAGSFLDTATATSDDTEDVQATDTVYGDQSPSLGITKTDNLNPAKYDHVGQVVTFTLTATNTGNVTLHDVTVVDDPALDGYSCDPATPATVAPGDSITCTGTHTITQADMDNGAFLDTATAVGKDTNDKTVGPVEATDQVNGVQSPAISISKTPDSQTISSGSSASFSITVTNTGNVTLTDVSVDDPNSTGCNRTSAQIAGLATMAPGAKVTYSCSRSNVTSGFTNTATATGTAPDDSKVTAQDSAVVSVTTPTPTPTPTPPTPTADISVTKQATPAVELPAGGGSAPITYTLVVKNNGPSAAQNVKVADSAPASVTFVSASTSAGSCTTTALALDCSISSLASGGTATITVNATVNATGTKVNTVIVTTTTSGDNPANNQASAQTVVTAPVTPPTPKPTPKPKPKPEICNTVTATPKMLKASKKKQTIAVRVTKGTTKVGVKGAKVKITGPGISKTVKTGKNGLAKVSFKPTKPGIVKVAIVGTKACNSQRLGVVGNYEPPVTG